MLEALVDAALILLALVFAGLSISLRELNRAIAAFAAFSVTLSAAFYAVGAPYVAVFQLLVYAGAVTVLFLAALHTLGGGEAE
ncbi:MAG: hydrogenase subunit MbhD domain-containing protein [Candidatus Bathyarchaeia archaeon]